MKIEQLAELGGVRPTELVKRQITWSRLDENSGEEISDTFDIFVRRLAFIDQEQMLRMAFAERRNAGETDSEEDTESKSDINSSPTSALISVAIRLGDDGTEQLTYEQAKLLEPNLARVFLDEINRVNPSSLKKKARNPRRNMARTGVKRDRRKNDRGSEAKR